MTRPRSTRTSRRVQSGALGADDRAAKLVDKMVRALVVDTVDTGRTEFVDGGIGSSIMMGYDNW